MVTETVGPQVQQSRANGKGVVVEVPPAVTSSSYGPACPRCETLLIFGYFEPQCPKCGYVCYDYTPPQSLASASNIVSSGRRSVLRYVGDFQALSETLTYVTLVRERNRAVYRVKCPFCGVGMVQSSLSGKRRERREERYKCDEGHRVSLTPGKDGLTGWK
jgi:hypothetical protein